MKKIIIILGVFICLHCKAQSVEHLPSTVKAPDIAAFEKVSFIPVSEYTGRVKTEIPIYTINFEGLLIPINISYNSGGVKINSISSRVGLNWSLNAGGFISREIKGDDDFVGVLAYNTSSSSATYSRFGFLGMNNYYTGWPRPGSRIDRQPDVYYVSAPGLLTQFTNKSNEEILELTPKGSKFEATVQNSTSSGVPYTYKSFTITSSEGFIYDFGQKEKSSYSYYNYQGSKNAHETINTLFCCASGGGQIVNNFSSLHLSTIKHPVSGNVVEFQYEDNLIEDFNLRIERDFDMNGNFFQQNDYHSDYLNEKVIKKILFNEGEIEFYYSNDRSDLIGGKRLIKIEIRDANGKNIKSVHLVQDYFTSSDNCSDPMCLRLRLNEIYFQDSSNNVLPGYQFDYNSTKLPKRYSYKQDFLGYYNAANVSGTYLYIPEMYFKESQGKNSYIPFNVTNQGYSALPGNFSLISNINFSKAASLEKITYPTKGYATFGYELNSFNFLGEEIQGGGLRLKTYKLFDFDDSLKRQKDYLYENENGLSSGSILFTPQFIKHILPNRFVISQKSNNDYELTGNSYVGYSRVKIIENNNGYLINQYTSPKEFSNIIPSSYTTNNTNEFTSYGGITNAFNRGIFPSLWQSMENRRGKLLSAKIYDQNNALKKEVINNYQYEVFDQIGIGQSFNMSVSSGEPEDMLWEPYALASSKIVAERDLLINTIEKNYLSNGELIIETTNIYDSNLPFIKERNIKVNDNKIQKEKYQYPFDVELSGLPEMVALKNQNIISKPVKSESYLDANIVSTQYIKYKDWGGNIILPETIQTSKGDNTLKNNVIYHGYDNKGNPTELSKSDGTHIVYIWGYKQTQPIAKIKNATYASIPSATITNLQTLSDADNDRTINEGALRTALNNLRTTLPNAMVTSYTYDQLIGVTSITDPKGDVVTYHYDSFNRLEFMKDKDGNILKENKYHYKSE